jgi:hypothetical protein
MLRRFITILFLGLLPSIAWAAEEPLSFEAGRLRVLVDQSGQVQSLCDTQGGQDYLAPGQPAPLLTLVLPDKDKTSWAAPTSASFDRASRRLTLGFGSMGATAVVRVVVKPTHLTFELESVEIGNRDGDKPMEIHWGPLPTTIHQTVGEVVGVVRDDQFAIGIQSLNLQTDGGAKATDFRRAGEASSTQGSQLFASAIEHDGGVKGSKIALFACPAKEALATIGQIELAEGLFHPLFDGVWAKTSPRAKSSYLIIPFGENTIDEVCRYADQAGLKYVYNYPEPFKTWGHFQLNPDDFPHGDAGMKRCVETAAEHGMWLGVHTLSGFITTNDPYVTPIPDPRLARSGSSTLAAAADEKATEIVVTDAAALSRRIEWDAPMNTVIIGEELVRFEKVSDQSPWRLLGCQRGSFGTLAAAHPAGADIGRLADHNYKTFYPGIDNGMMDEMTARLVELVNNTGLRLLSFDGLEGVSTYGHGWYAGRRFVKQCSDGWKQTLINDASNLHHFTWHYHTRMNWGEPWGKAMREGQTELRFKNQPFFERNLLPLMLGWFEIRAASADLEATTVDDIEWMLAKSAGFDAGFAITAAKLEALRTNALTPAILAAVRLWEKARLSQKFSEQQRQRLQGRDEFHLESLSDGGLLLTPVAFSFSSHPMLGEGQETKADIPIENQHTEQPLRFVMRVQPIDKAPSELAVVNPSFETGGRRVTLAVNLKPGQYLANGGERSAIAYDANWNQLSAIQSDAEPPKLATGRQTVVFRCHGSGAGGPRIQVKLETRGRPDRVAP